jgi:hypothetical protein
MIINIKYIGISWPKMGVKCFFLAMNFSHPSNKRSRGVNDTNVFVWGEKWAQVLTL